MKPVAFKIIEKEHATIHIQDNREHPFYRRYHYHPEYQISLVQEGNGVLLAGNGLSNFSPGDVFMFAPNIPHLFRKDSEETTIPLMERSHLLSIFFLDSSFGNQFFQLPEMKKIQELLLTAKKGLKLLPPLAKKISPLMIEMNKLSGARQLLHFLELLHQISLSKQWRMICLNSPEIVSRADSYFPLRKVMQYIRRNFDRSLTLEEVAGVANLSKYAFCRYFRQSTHKSFITFLNEFRISMACKYLADHQYSVSQIGFLAGYNNLSNFYRQFKKVMNCTPAKYRKWYGGLIDTNQ